METHVQSLSEEVASFESGFTSNRLTNKYLIARLDGRSFSKFTKRFKRNGEAYNTLFARLMMTTAKTLLEQNAAEFAYTQSDEMTLLFVHPQADLGIWPPEDEGGTLPFGGRVGKIGTVLSGQVSSIFTYNFFSPVYSELSSLHSENSEIFPHFDCRLFGTDDPDMVRKCFLARGLDGRRNAVQMAASSHFSHRELHKKSTSDMREMLQRKGINFEDYPYFFKRGTFLTKSEFFALTACSHSGIEFERGDFSITDMRPSLSTNSIAVWESVK